MIRLAIEQEKSFRNIFVIVPITYPVCIGCYCGKILPGQQFFSRPHACGTAAAGGSAAKSPFSPLTVLAGIAIAGMACIVYRR